MIAHLVLQGNRLEALGNILQQAKGSCDILNSGQAPPSSPKKKSVMLLFVFFHVFMLFIRFYCMSFMGITVHYITV